jgi:transcriptional regulator with PAS, ATPase and Fis domain
MMKQALNLAKRCASSAASSALLVGESGVGKEVIAAYIHRSSARAKNAFVRINVAAIPETMVEAELFGAVRGAFTDSKRDRQGFFSAADGGTLLLDEIGELRIDLQAKLLRAIETKRFFPVGASRELSSDARIVAATNRDPAEAVATGRLRADLYYRLAGMVIYIPALRERREDVPALVRAVLAKERRKTGRGPSRFSEDAMVRLCEYDWPGNVRELKNAVERVCMLTDGEVASARDLEECGIFVGVGSIQSMRMRAAVVEAAYAGDAVAMRGAPPSSPQMPGAPPSYPSGMRAAAPIAPGTATSGTWFAAPTPQSTPAITVPTAPPASAPGAAGVGASGLGGVPESLESIVRVASEEAERRHIVSVLERTNGNRTKAAEVMNISRSTLWHKLRRYGLDDGGT